VVASSNPIAELSRWGLKEGGSVCVFVKGVVEDARSGILTGGAVSWGTVCTADMVELRNADGVSERVGLGEHEMERVNL
jgi:hypothetical protein